MHIDRSFWSTLDIAAPSHSGDMGAVLLASCPGLRGADSVSESDIKHDVEKLAAAGAGFVLSLIEAKDRDQLGVSNLDTIIADAGLKVPAFRSKTGTFHAMTRLYSLTACLTIWKRGYVTGKP